MNSIHKNSCPICKQTIFKDFLVCKDHYATREDFQLMACSQCGFVFTQDFPSEEVIGRYYHVSDYISHSDTKEGLTNRLYHLARRFALRSKSRIICRYSKRKSGTLLDIGCGTGYFLNQMRKKQWIVTGIEKDEETRKYAKEKFNLNTHAQEYFFQILKEKKDVITMWHVLEHVEQLNKTMQQLHRILCNDGIAVIALPNRDSLDAKYYKEYWAAYDVPRHLWHFSPDNFELLANKHNFKVIEKKPMYFDAFYISMLSEKYKGTTAAPLVGLCRGMLFFLRSLANKNKCSSITYILKKNQ